MNQISGAQLMAHGPDPASRAVLSTLWGFLSIWIFGSMGAVAVLIAMVPTAKCMDPWGALQPR